MSEPDFGIEKMDRGRNEYRLFAYVRKMLNRLSMQEVIRTIAAVLWKARRAQFIKAHKVVEGAYWDRDLYRHPSILNTQVFDGEILEDDPIMDEDYNGECLDHSEIWEKDGKPYLMTSQPYQVSKDDLRKLIAHCDAYDIDFQIDADSFYFPGGTIRILFKKERITRHIATKHQHQRVEEPIDE